MAGKKGAPRVEWTQEQDGDLRRLWRTTERIKHHMHLFGAHSYDAVIMRAYTLGLGRRENCPRGAQSISWQLIAEQLKKGPATRFQIANVLGMHPSTAHVELCTRLKSSEVHVVKWQRGARGGRPVPVYAFGPGANVPMPEPIGNAENLRRIRRSKREQRVRAGDIVMGVNPFATALGIVPMPSGIAGRVIRQDTDVLEAEAA